jgi:hypothetical protein
MSRLEAVALTALAGLTGCSSPDPDAEIAALLERAEAAAEARETGFFRDLISEDYVDRRGRTRADVIDMIRGYFFVNARIDVVSRVQSVEVSGDDAAEIVLLAALVSRAEGRSVLGTAGDFYRLELELAKEGSDWRVIGADWGRSP